MKRIIKVLICIVVALISVVLTETVVMAEGSNVYTVTGSDGSYSLLSGGVSIADSNELSELVEYLPTEGEYELYFDTVTADEGISLFGGDVTLGGVLSFLGDASLTVDGAHLKISSAALAFESGSLRVKRGTLSVSGGSVSSGGVAVLSDFSASATVSISGGSIYSDTASAVVVERGSISVFGGTVRGAESAIIAYTGATFSGTPTLSGREYDIVSDTELTLFSERGIFRGAVKIKLLSEFAEGCATPAVYTKSAESLVGITLFDINGISHTLHFLDKNESGVGESVGAVLLPYKVTFYDGEDILLRSEYIKGRELVIPDAPESLGFTFSGWRTSDGELFDFNRELKSDVALFSSYTLTSPTYTLISPSFVYDGGTRYIVLSDLFHPLLSEGFISYEWHKDGAPLNSFGESHPVRTVADSGKYTVKITFTVGKSSVSHISPVADVLISKKVVEPPTIPSAKYTGTDISPGICDTAEYTVAPVRGTLVGTYPVEITLRDSDNYCFLSSDKSAIYVDFVIEKGINEWITPLTVSDIYVGGVLTPTASSLFGSVEILYRRVGDTHLTSQIPTEAGEYIARAFVTGTDNYTPLDGVEVTFKIIAEHVVGISVTSRPHKDTYLAFEHLSPEGIEVLAMYNSTRLAVVDADELVFIYQSADSFRYGDSGITVSYGGVNVTLPLTVEKAEYDLSGISFSDISLSYSGTLVTVPLPDNIPIGLDGIPLVGTVRGGGTNVGEYPVSLEFSSDSRNYKIPESIYATLTVTPYECEAVWGDTVFVYDGGEKLPTAFYLDVFGRRVIAEVRGGRSIAGEYTATIEIFDKNYVIINPTTHFVINRADYDISSVVWCGGGDVYDGSEKVVYVTSLPEGVGVIAYVNNRATESGTYTARVSLSYDSVNYNPPAVPEYSWQILRRDYELQGFRFADAEYIYDKNPHYPTLVGDMPVGIDGVRLGYEFSHGVVNVREGRAAVSVIFKTESKNYNIPDSCIAYVTVLPKEITVLWTGLSATYSGAYILPVATSPECSITVVGGGSMAGEYEICATADDPNYTVVNSTASLVISKAQNKWIVTPSVNDIFYGREPSPVAEAIAGAVQYTYYSASDPEKALRDLPRAVGEYLVTASSDGDNNYLPISCEPMRFKIIAVVPVSLDVSLGKGEFSAFEVVDGNIEVYLSYNDGTRLAIDRDKLTVSYPRAEHFLFGDCEVTVSHAGYTVTLPVAVKKADYDLSAVRWENTLTVYDGSFKCACLTGLPSGLSVSEYIGGGVGAGEYTVRAVLSYDAENYNAPTLSDVTLTVAKRLIPTPIIPSVEYNGSSIVPTLPESELYTFIPRVEKHPGLYPIVFSVKDKDNYEFTSGESVSVDFVIEKRKLTLQINSVELGLFERAPDFSFEIINGTLIDGDEILLEYSVSNGKIFGSVNIPNYDITILEGDYIRTYKMSPISALILLLVLLLLTAIALISAILVRRYKRALHARVALVAVGGEIGDSTVDNTALTEENAGQKESSNDITIQEPISAEYANSAISNSLAKDLIRREVTVLTGGWRRGIINVDTLSESFTSGERVDVNILKRKSLIPYDTAYIKVLARGVIDKPLYVYANDFSLSAVKMIALAGGKSIKVTTEIEKKENLDKTP